MRKLLTIFIWCYGSLSAQTVTSVGTGEYVTSFLKSDGTVGLYSQSTITPTIQTYSGLDSVVMLAGGQYHVEALDQRGRVWKLGNTTSVITDAPTDQFGAEFKDNFYITGFYQCNVSIRNPDSTVWYWGIADPMNYSSTEPITQPIAITMPTGKKMKKVLTGTNTGFNDGITFIVGLASDGTLWRWSKKTGASGLTTPTQIVISGETVVDFGVVSFQGIIAATASNKLYSCGGSDTRYVGAVSHSVSVTDITSRWTSAGLDFPIKEIGSGSWALHIIDANDEMFGAGSDAMGNVGIGFEKPNMKTASGTDGVWSIDIAQNGAYMQAPVQLRGKFKNIRSGTSIVFYNYVQDLAGNWYSWGRNKSFSLANGTSLGPYAGWGGTGDYAQYPNAKDIPMPRRIYPLMTTYSLINFNSEDDPAPVVGAGINQYINGTTTTLYGIVHQQEFTITSTTWSKISGPSGGAITSPSALSTGITGLIGGTYVFRLSATNSNGQTSTNDIDVVVNSSPMANAGSDIQVYLPTTTASLSGSGSDADGSISSYLWSKVIGPSGGTIVSPTSASTNISSLQQGTYVFRLTVTDNQGAQASDTMSIYVDDPYGLPLIANAGADLTVALTQPNGVSSETSVTLNASGSQNASQFLWESLGNSATIFSPFTKTTKISGLVAGNNLFKFTVSDGTNYGYDTINIRVVDWQARGKRPCRVGAPVVHELTATSTTQIYRLYLERDYPEYADIKGGDTIKIARNPNNGGIYTGISIGDFGGSPECPVIIVPKDTVVTVSGGASSYFRVGATDTNFVSHVIFDGTYLRNKGIRYGFQHVNNPAENGPIGITANRVSNITFKGFYIEGVGVGALIKVNSDSLRDYTLYNNHRIYNLRMEDNYFKNINGEGVYLGHTAPNGNQGGSDGHVPRIDSVYFINNVIDSCEWDGPQISNGRYAVIEGNTVTRVGVARLINQRSGIIIGGNSTGKVANNILVNGSDGIVGTPYGRVEVYNNFVDSIDGGLGTHDALYLSSPPTASGVTAAIIEDNPPVEWRVYNNIIRNPQRYAVYLPNNGGDQIKGKISDNYIIDATRNEGQLINTALGDTVTNNTIYTSFPVTVRQYGNSVIGNNLMVTANGETRYFDNAYAAFDFIKFKLTGVSSAPASRKFRKIKATSIKRY